MRLRGFLYSETPELRTRHLPLLPLRFAQEAQAEATELLSPPLLLVFLLSPVPLVILSL